MFGDTDTIFLFCSLKSFENEASIDALVFIAQHTFPGGNTSVSRSWFSGYSLAYRFLDTPVR